MSLQEMSGGNGGVPPANPTSTVTAPATGGQPGSDQGGPQGSGGPSGSEGSGTGDLKLAAWTQQVSKEIRENLEFAKELAPFEKLDDLVKAHFDQKKKSAIPGKDAKPEEVTAFWKQLGYPEKPEGYALAKDQNAAAFLAAAHAARLTDGQASSLWKEVSQNQVRALAARQEAQKAELAAALDGLKKEYGEQFNAVVELFDRAVGNTGKENSPLMTRLLDAGLLGEGAVIRAFIALGEARQESGSPRSDGLQGQPNKSVLDGSWYTYGKTK